MKSFRLRVRVPRGSILIGGYTPVPVGLDAVHARGPRLVGEEAVDASLVPATALRGALRQSLEAILRGAGQPACSRGTGLDVDDDHGDDEPPGECMDDDGRPCLACQLFGRPAERTAPERGYFSALVLGDAVEVGGMTPSSVRHGVGIDRRRRSAKERILFDASAPTPSPDLVFEARGRLLDPALEPQLRAAVAATTHIGGRRSRGFGRVDLEIDPSSDAIKAHRIETSAVTVRFRLASPAMIGGVDVGRNSRETRPEVPGSVLRGALGFALAEHLDDPDRDDAFQGLVDESKGARFGFAYPARSARPSKLAVGVQARFGLEAHDAAEPWPITARICKTGGEAHGVTDRLIDRIAASADEASDLDRSRLGQLTDEACLATGCSSPLRGVSGSRAHVGRPPTRTVTRVSIDRRLDSARSGALFTQELLEAGLEFETTISEIPPEARARLGEGLALPFSLGRGRSMGWGSVTVLKVSRPAEMTGTKKRAKAFHRLLQHRLQALDLPSGTVERLVPLTLLSPLVPSVDEPETMGEHDILSRLPEGSRVVLGLRRFARAGRWDQRGRGQIPPRTTVEAGGVFVVELPEGARLQDLESTLAAFESEGIGQWTTSGYGRLRAFDPFHTERYPHAD